MAVRFEAFFPSFFSVCCLTIVFNGAPFWRIGRWLLAFLWFVTCVLLVMVCLFFFVVPLVAMICDFGYS